MEKIVVVVIKPDRQSFEDRSGQGCWIAAPLFLRVAFEKRFVERRAHKGEGLILKGLWIGDASVRLVCDKGACLFWAHGFAIELVDCVQVDR